MNSSPKKILLTCFDFPPNKGIGGRRWSKISKELVRKGYQVHVIKCAPKVGFETSGWSKDVESDQIIVHELPRTYPQILSNPSSSKLDRIKYRLVRAKFLKKYRGTIYDNSLGWEEIYPNLLKDILKKERIDNLIVTGAPFNLLYYAAQVKTVHPDLNLIVDYRDPWINAKNYGMQDLDESRMKAEKEKQQLVLEQANHVLYPSPRMGDEIREHALNPDGIKAKLQTLTHYYDMDDFSFSPSIPQKGKKIKLIYGGAVYAETEPYIELLDRSLTALKEKSSSLYNRLELSFYTDHRSRLNSLEKHANCAVHAPIGKDYYQQAMAADLVFIFLGNHNKHFKTTKFLETLPLKKPFAYLGPEGDVSKSIRADQLGYVLSDEGEFEQMIVDAAEDQLNYDLSYDHKQFSLSKITEQVIELFVAD